MPSRITRMTEVSFAEVYELDDRYGVKRQHFGFATAKDMARLDDLIEAAKIVPGDSVEILWRQFVPNKELGRMEEKHTWAKVEGGTFLEIDNGRFRIQDSTGKRVGGFELENILDVRKSTNSSANE